MRVASKTGQHLLSEGADGGVGLLGDVEYARISTFRPMYAARGHGPQAAQDPEQARLATAIGARHQDRVPLLYAQAQPPSQQLPCWRDHIYLHPQQTPWANTPESSVIGVVPEQLADIPAREGILSSCEGQQ
jgi:hypothetical protein